MHTDILLHQTPAEHKNVHNLHYQCYTVSESLKNNTNICLVIFANLLNKVGLHKIFSDLFHSFCRQSLVGSYRCMCPSGPHTCLGSDRVLIYTGPHLADKIVFFTILCIWNLNTVFFKNKTIESINLICLINNRFTPIFNNIYLIYLSNSLLLINLVHLGKADIGTYVHCLHTEFKQIQQ